MLNPDPKMLTQLSLLSQLIGSNTNKDESRSGLVKLSLFDDDDDEDDFRPPPFVFLHLLDYYLCYIFDFLELNHALNSHLQQLQIKGQNMKILASMFRK